MKKYIVRDSIAGNTIDIFNTLEEAQQEVKSYEEQDKEDGIYEEHFYEIVDEEEKAIRFDIAQDLTVTLCGTPLRSDGYEKYRLDDGRDVIIGKFDSSTDTYWDCWVEGSGESLGILSATFDSTDDLIALGKGKMIGFDSYVALMDDEIREHICFKYSFDTDEEFLEKYLELHGEKYGEEFTI